MSSVPDIHGYLLSQGFTRAEKDDFVTRYRRTAKGHPGAPEVDLNVEVLELHGTLAISRTATFSLVQIINPGMLNFSVYIFSWETAIRDFYAIEANLLRAWSAFHETQVTRCGVLSI